MFNVSRFRVRNPVSTPRTRANVWINSPAPISSTNARATSEQISAARSLRDPETPAIVLALCLRDWLTSNPRICNSGTRPNETAVATVTAIVNPSTRQSMAR